MREGLWLLGCRWGYHHTALASFPDLILRESLGTRLTVHPCPAPVQTVAMVSNSHILAKWHLPQLLQAREVESKSLISSISLVDKCTPMSFSTPKFTWAVLRNTTTDYLVGSLQSGRYYSALAMILPSIFQLSAKLLVKGAVGWYHRWQPSKRLLPRAFSCTLQSF